MSRHITYRIWTIRFSMSFLKYQNIYTCHHVTTIWSGFSNSFHGMESGWNYMLSDTIQRSLNSTHMHVSHANTTGTGISDDILRPNSHQNFQNLDLVLLSAPKYIWWANQNLIKAQWPTHIHYNSGDVKWILTGTSTYFEAAFTLTKIEKHWVQQLNKSCPGEMEHLISSHLLN